MATQLGIVVGIDSGNGCKAYRSLIATISAKQGVAKQYNWQFECKLLTEEQLIDTLNRKVKWLNVKLDNGKIKGSSGDLKRFDSNEHKPFVIISQLINSDNKIIGYKIANYNGGVKNIPLKEILAYGRRAVKQGFIPIQNAIFVDETNASDNSFKSAHFKAYPNCSFIQEVLPVQKNQYAEKRRVNTQNNNKSLSKLEEIYTPEQIKQLKLGKEHGVEIRVYANPSLSAKQMMVLREGLEQKLNVKPFAFPDYSVDAMRYYMIELRTGMDIRQYLSPKYSIAQIAELSIAVDEGLDISKMNDPSLSVRQMQERRIRLENNVFHEEDVKIDGSWI